jgi:hypothetical protein
MQAKQPMDSDEILLQKCKHLIEEKLGWENGDSWTNHDFQALSIKIQDATGVNLSVATLKRIWGKVRYDSKPTITTLNTLAQFTGYENWRAFKQGNAKRESSVKLNGTAHDISPEVVTVADPVASPKRKLWRSGLIGTALCGGVLILLMYGVRHNSAPATPASYSFSSKKIVSEGVPNSVVFDYDASAAGTDTVYIQQSWDERLRKRVDKNEHQHTSIYYTPGFFQAKLVVGNKIVKEHKLLITSNGWLALVKQDPVPIYFSDADFRKPGMLSLPLDKLKENNIALQPETPWASYYNVKDFGDITTDNFTFETEVRSEYRDGSGICQGVQILLLTEGNVIIVPLSIKGCISNLNLFFGDYVEGEKKDLSAFGVDLSQWVKVGIEVKDRKSRVRVNGQIAYEGNFTSRERIVGMIFRFQGTGSVNEVKLASGNGSSVFEDTF